MIPPGALAGLLPALLLAVCFFSPIAVGLSIADGLEGRIGVDPGEDFEKDLLGPWEGGPIDGEPPDTHVYDFENSPGDTQRRYQNFPRNARVALVLRGASFRNQKRKNVACLYSEEYGQDTNEERGEDTHAFRLQRNATESLVEHVIMPLEQAGNTVDVIVTDHHCPLTRKIATWIGDSAGHPRVKVVSSQPPDADVEQRHNLMFALDELAKYSWVKGKDAADGVAAKYSYVFVMRHDTVWIQPVTAWPTADFSKVLWPYICGKWGAHDLFTVMPASYFGSYYKTLELNECFKGVDGHFCIHAMGKREGWDSVGVAMHWGNSKSGSTTWDKPFDYWYTYGRSRHIC
jgi:hypothetical protein